MVDDTRNLSILVCSNNPKSSTKQIKLTPATSPTSLKSLIMTALIYKPAKWQKESKNWTMNLKSAYAEQLKQNKVQQSKRDRWNYWSRHKILVSNFQILSVPDNKMLSVPRNINLFIVNNNRNTGKTCEICSK